MYREFVDQYVSREATARPLMEMLIKALESKIIEE